MPAILHSVLRYPGAAFQHAGIPASVPRAGIPWRCAQLCAHSIVLPVGFKLLGHIVAIIGWLAGRPLTPLKLSAGFNDVCLDFQVPCGALWCVWVELLA